LPGVIFLGALAVRLVAVDFGLPYAYNYDEPFVAMPVLRFVSEGEWLPHYYRYPSGYIYLQFFTTPLSCLLHAVRQGGAPKAFTDFYLVGRLSTVAFGVTAVALVYFFTRRLAGVRWAGAFAAAVLALSPLHVAGSRFMTTDVPMATTAFAAVFVLTSYLRRGDLRYLAGAAVLFGAAIAIKYNATFFFIPAAILVAIRERNWTRPALLVGMAAVIFLLLNPGVAFDRAVFFGDVFRDSRHYFYLGDATGTAFFPWPRFLAHLWSYALTPGPFLLAAAGAVLLLWRERRAGICFLIFPLSYSLFMVFIRITHVRTLQPLLPFAAVLAGYAAAVGMRELGRRVGPRPAGVIAAVLCVAALSRPAYITVRETAGLLQPDNRTLAKEWFEANVPWPQLIAKESGNPASLARGGQLDGPPLEASEYEIHVAPCVVARDAASYAAAGYTYVVVPDLEESLNRAVAADPAGADGYRRNYSSLLEDASPVLMIEPRKYGPPFGVQIYRLRDETLRSHRPPRRGVVFREKWVRSEADPSRKMGRVEGRFALEAPARAGACFTAPAERFRVVAFAEVLAGDPRIVLEVDGAEVAAKDLSESGVVKSPPLAAPPYYRHLAVRCIGPAGSRARLKSVIVDAAPK
jgi:4-amino-4-deoxy-L-arabinose transferase-like glycosyltransferase